MALINVKKQKIQLKIALKSSTCRIGIPSFRLIKDYEPHCLVSCLERLGFIPHLAIPALYTVPMPQGREV